MSLLGRLTLASCSFVAVACVGASGQGTTTPTGDRPNTLLVVTHTAGFRHDSIPTAEATLAALGDRSGLFAVRYCRNAADVARLLTPEALQDVDAVFFANTTGELGAPALDALLAWINGGRGFLGAHSASDTYHGEPRYIEMLGAEFKTHGNQAEVDVRVDAPDHPATAGLGSRFTIFDEIYHFTDNNRGRVNMLLSLDRAPDDGLPSANQPADMPLAWTKPYGSGRVFYTALGHRDEVWQDARFQTHLLGAIRWATGN
jgi:hypothetical protein